MRARAICLILISLLLSSITLCNAQAMDDMDATDLNLSPVVSYKHAGFGVGYGVPYSGFGFSGDYYLTGDLGATASLGAFGSMTGYELGVKYFFRPYYKSIRPKLTLLYGVNQSLRIDNDPADDTYEVFNGLSVCAGAQWMFGKDLRHGFDIDLVYVVFSGLNKRLDELEQIGWVVDAKRSRWKTSIGYRFAF